MTKLGEQLDKKHGPVPIPPPPNPPPPPPSS